MLKENNTSGLETLLKHWNKYFLVFLQNQTYERLQTHSGRVEHRDFGSIQTQTRSVAVSTVGVRTYQLHFFLFGTVKSFSPSTQLNPTKAVCVATSPWQRPNNPEVSRKSCLAFHQCCVAENQAVVVLQQLPPCKGVSGVFLTCFQKIEGLLSSFTSRKETVASEKHVWTLCCCICGKHSPQGLSPELNQF